MSYGAFHWVALVGLTQRNGRWRSMTRPCFAPHRGVWALCALCPRPARARYRPRMHGFPCQDRKGTPRRSAGYQKPKRAILLCLSARHKHKERHCARKRKSHRETKRASHGKWRCTRVRNESNFGARWFMEGEASLEARVGRWCAGVARRPSGPCRGMLVSESA